MRPHLRFPALTLFLLALVAAALVRPGPGAVRADEPPKKEGGDKEPGKGDPPKPGDPAKPDGEEDTDDFFDGETSFTAKEVDEAIKKGVNWLRKKQGGEGGWGDITGTTLYGGGQGTGYPHPAGCTALSLYTMLKCGVSPKDPTITRGFKFIQDRKLTLPDGSYETSVLLLAVAATADQAKSLKASDKKLAKATLSGPMRKWAQDLVAHLLEKRQARTWRYNIPNGAPAPGGNEDLSSTQLATLALFYAHRLGIKVKDQVWEDILAYALDQQDDSGPEVVIEEDPVTKKVNLKGHARGFAYLKGNENPGEGKATGGMTACGVAIVMMARFALQDGGKKKAQWDTRSDSAKVQEGVYDGLGWLITNWSPFENPQRPNAYHLYYLYAFERMMDLVGKQLLAKHNWYSEMGQQILNRQAEDGHWQTGSTLEPNDVQDSCFALLFLKRATKGVIPFPAATGGSEEQPVDGR
jgi:hypothetical protein